MGSIIGHRIDYNGVGALHILQKFTQVLPPPYHSRGSERVQVTHREYSMDQYSMERKSTKRRLNQP